MGQSTFQIGDLAAPFRDSRFLDPAAIAETLAALVRIESVNPMYGGPEGGEARVIAWAADFLRGFGLAPRIFEAFPGRPCLRVMLAGEQPGPPLLFQTHIDTVSIAGMTIEPFAARIEDGRLLGRGSTDAKAQAAAMLHALAAWATCGRKPPRAIELALCCDEEAGFGGARALLRDGPENRINACGIVIGEPTDLHVVATHKGAVRWWIRFEGRAVHAARMEQGVNAISHAAALIGAINEKLLPVLRQRRAPLLNSATLNVGLIEGGIQANMVPPLCRVHLERRLLPGEDAALALGEVQALIDELASSSATSGSPAGSPAGSFSRALAEFRAVQEPPVLYAAPLATDLSAPLVALACSVAAAHGAPGEPEGVDYATDGSALAASGLPIVVCGPGSIDQAHTADEFVELEAVAAGARLYADLMSRAGEL